jgi:hypothetical protein
MVYSINEISTPQADLIKSFAIFYLLLVGNYIASSLFTCFQINFIKSHKALQLVIAFFLFYFLVTLVSNTGNLELTPPIEKLLYSLFYFMGFLLLMRLDIRVSAIVMILIFVIYFIELNKDYYLEGENQIHNVTEKMVFEDNQYWITLNWPFKIRLFPVQKQDFKRINQIENAIYYVIILLLVFGFISYTGEIRDSLKKGRNLSWLDIVTDTEICKIKEKQGFWHHFKSGLGVKI